MDEKEQFRASWRGYGSPVEFLSGVRGYAVKRSGRRARRSGACERRAGQDARRIQAYLEEYLRQGVAKGRLTG
jgi:hypothetical protein